MTETFPKSRLQVKVEDKTKSLEIQINKSVIKKSNTFFIVTFFESVTRDLIVE